MGASLCNIAVLHELIAKFPKCLNEKSCAGGTNIISCNVLLFLQMKEAIMNQEKLAKLQEQVRIGGKVID